MSTMTYKGQIAQIHYNALQDKFIGQFRVGKKDIKFEGKTLHILAQTLETTVNEYCKKTKIIHANFKRDLYV